MAKWEDFRTIQEMNTAINPGFNPKRMLEQIMVYDRENSSISDIEKPKLNDVLKLAYSIHELLDAFESNMSNVCEKMPFNSAQNAQALALYSNSRTLNRDMKSLLTMLKRIYPHEWAYFVETMENAITKQTPSFEAVEDYPDVREDKLEEGKDVE